MSALRRAQSRSRVGDGESYEGKLNLSGLCLRMRSRQLSCGRPGWPWRAMLLAPARDCLAAPVVDLAACQGGLKVKGDARTTTRGMEAAG